MIDWFMLICGRIDMKKLPEKIEFFDNRYKYNEPEYMQELVDYIDSTYGQHYVNQGIQVVDVWQSMGSLNTTARDTAIKYLSRFGKKNGKNRKDLLKALHYIILMMYAEDSENDDTFSE